MPERFTLIVTPEAREDLRDVTDTRTYRALRRKIDGLADEPGKQGKALSGDLSAYRAVRAAEQRYRVVYLIAMLGGVVTVVVVGIRKEGDKRDV